VPLFEFDLIDRYFARPRPRRADVRLGIGDDAAVLDVSAGTEIVVASDTYTSGPPGAAALPPPEEIAHRALAGALAGLAAAGASPAWFTLALTLPAAAPDWLEPFSRTLLDLGAQFGAELVGGDTTSGPLAVTVHAHGVVPAGGATPPSGARPGDLIFVTGTLGDAGLAILARRGEVRLPGKDRALVERRLTRPEPRLTSGWAIRGLASAAVDLPDGLAGGLSELLGPDGPGATLYAEQLPISETLRRHLERSGGWVLPLTGPGDGEMCFTLAAERQAELAARLGDHPPGCTWVGTVDRAPGLRCLLADGTDIAPSWPASRWGR
jgi:thiamine-monophosphate kinase